MWSSSKIASLATLMFAVVGDHQREEQTRRHIVVGSPDWIAYQGAKQRMIARRATVLRSRGCQPLEFRYGDKKVYALNQEDADRKARRKGYL